MNAAKAGTTQRYSIRVMIVGEGTAGKTSLFRRLINTEIDKNEMSTDGINIERRKGQVNVHTGTWSFPKGK